MGLLSWFAGSSNPAASVAAGAVSGVLDGVGKAANEIREAITGKLSADDQASFELKMQTLTQVLQEGQQAINLADAQSGSNFRGGWRPAIGWTCAMALWFYYVPPVIMATILWTIQGMAIIWQAEDVSKVILPAFPSNMNIQEILGLVAALLGLAGMRSWDKKQGNY
ncbi:MAG: 3TM-type holin [Desulfobacterales bacterium]|nr:3TM-type holin [Desulfobacterales bacterium]